MRRGRDDPRQFGFQKDVDYITLAKTGEPAQSGFQMLIGSSLPPDGTGQAGGFTGWISVKEVHRNGPNYKQTRADSDDDPQSHSSHDWSPVRVAANTPPPAPRLTTLRFS